MCVCVSVSVWPEGRPCLWPPVIVVVCFHSKLALELLVLHLIWPGLELASPLIEPLLRTFLKKCDFMVTPVWFLFLLVLFLLFVSLNFPSHQLVSPYDWGMSSQVSRLAASAIKVSFNQQHPSITCQESEQRSLNFSHSDLLFKLFRG